MLEWKIFYFTQICLYWRGRTAGRHPGPLRGCCPAPRPVLSQQHRARGRVGRARPAVNVTSADRPQSSVPSGD